MKRLIASLAVILPLVLIPQAQAARAAITIDQPAPTYGDAVTFSISETKDRPWVWVECFQAEQRVYSHTNDYGPYSLNKVFTMGPTTAWQSGSADCVARLIDLPNNSTRFPGRVLATTYYEVLP
jgi:hypothetical protein